ncbi:hypothetical protein WA026_017388, partial [Henosepilachna vigintioctopunctata]
MKINMILGMKNRLNKTCHHTMRDKNVRFLNNELLYNSYPKKLINKLLYTIQIDLSENSTSIQTDSVNSTNEGPVTSENKQYFSLPQIKELTPKISNVIKQSQEIILAHKQLKP